LEPILGSTGWTGQDRSDRWHQRPKEGSGLRFHRLDRSGPVGPVDTFSRKASRAQAPSVGPVPHRSDRWPTGASTRSLGGGIYPSPLSLTPPPYPFSSNSLHLQPPSSPLQHTSIHQIRIFKGRGPRIRGGGPLLHILLPRALKFAPLKSAGNFSFQGTNLILARSLSRMC
jgi:hypothetical protein